MALTLFLAGDVMTGRGVDQILPSPSNPELRELYIDSAQGYVRLAERKHGDIPAPVDPSYVWGDGLAVLAREQPAASVVNLETSITVSDEFWPGKAVHYRMHPNNIGCLEVVGIDVCALANNHMLDFGRSGLIETCEVLQRAHIIGVGAGRNLEQAARPHRLEVADGVGLVVTSVGSTTSGIPLGWAAGDSRAGVCLVPDLSTAVADDITARIGTHKRDGDIAVVSVHWGSNWGYDIDAKSIAFAHQLVLGGADIVHGHSSHHVRPIEVYQGKLILYGCGDLVTDYEGITGNEAWRGDIGAMFFATLSPRDGTLLQLRLIPTQMNKLQLTHASRADGRWLTNTLNRISRQFGTCLEQDEDGTIRLFQ